MQGKALGAVLLFKDYTLIEETKLQWQSQVPAYHDQPSKLFAKNDLEQPHHLLEYSLWLRESEEIF